MERIKQILEEKLNTDLLQIVLSDPRKKPETFGNAQGMEKDKALLASKVKIRPVQKKDRLFFQMTSYVGTQVFHTNYEKEELIAEIMLLLADFRQFSLQASDCQVTAMISKNGKATVKKRAAKKPERSGNSVSDERIPAMGDSGTCNKDRLSHNRKKNYILQEGVCVPFLQELGVQNTDGSIVRTKYDKFKQINRFLEYIEDVLPALPQDRKISIVDFGCGKSYLTFAIYYYLKILKGYDIDVIGLDLKKDVIQHCNRLRDQYGYENLHFLEGDIKNYCEKEEVDMVVTLHACDTATDYAIAKAISWNASVILTVPCCQHELNRQIKCDMLSSVLSYGILKDRMAAILTDAVRAQLMECYGYETQIMEFIDMAHTPKNLLLRGVKKKGMQKRPSVEKVKELLDALSCHQTLYDLLTGEAVQR